jgi:hypothetical protein
MMTIRVFCVSAHDAHLMHESSRRRHHSFHPSYLPLPTPFSAMTAAFYPIGTPGVAWSAAEIAQWRASRTVERSYQKEVVEALVGSATALLLLLLRRHRRRCRPRCFRWNSTAASPTIPSATLFM